jgi:hypothetical protein
MNMGNTAAARANLAWQATQPLLRFLPACGVMLYDHGEELRVSMTGYKYN